MWDLMFMAVLTGVGISLLTGSLGCFVVWRRLAYFGDALSHGTLLGLALALAIGLNLDVTIVGVCFLFSLVLMALERQGHLNSDSYLGILAHSGLAFGIIALALLSTRRVDLHSYLFGDLLLANREDIIRIFVVACLANLGLFFVWQPLLRTTLNRELAKAEGVNEALTGMVFFFVLALGIGISMRIIGALLINAMLIIPPSSASLFAKTPLQMVVFSIALEICAMTLGILASFYFDLPSSAAIVACMVGLFILLLMAKVLLSKLDRVSAGLPQKN